MKPEDLNAEFFMAEDHYNSVIAELRSVPATEENAPKLRNRLEEARVRLKNAAMELTSLELETTKSIIGGSVKRQFDMKRTKEATENLKNQRDMLKNQLEEAENTAEYLENLDREFTELTHHVNQAEEERIDLQTSIGLLRDQLKPHVDKSADLETTMGEIRNLNDQLSLLREDLEILSETYADTEPERVRSLLESERLEKEYNLLSIKASKLKDDIFLLARGHEQLETELSVARASLQDLIGELDEVKRFPLEPLPGIDKTEREHELEALDQEAIRLKVEIERIREKRFRERMRN
jgi:chromosome segregation ATPase